MASAADPRAAALPDEKPPTYEGILDAARRLEGLAVRTPLFEPPALAERTGGRVLVKAETSQAPGAAAQFYVSSIPALFALVDGEVVDMLAGMLPEPQLRDWIDRIVEMSALSEAKRLEESSPEAAEAAYHYGVDLLLQGHPQGLSG